MAAFTHQAGHNNLIVAGDRQVALLVDDQFQKVQQVAGVKRGRVRRHHAREVRQADQRDAVFLHHQALLREGAVAPALDGEIDAQGPKGKRTIKAGDYFKGLYETALGPQEILTAIRLPAANAGSRVGFAELARRHGDYAIVGLAASARADGKGLKDVRLAYFGVGNTPLRAEKSEAALVRGDVDGAVAALDLEPHDDIQATGAVKKHLAGVLLRRVAAQLMEQRP